MIEIQEMSANEIEEMLRRVGYGHFACSLNDRPYVVPIHYVYVKPDIYIYTTEGMKTEMINSNPHVCLQVEEIVNRTDWRSIVINGEAEPVVNRDEKDEIVKQILLTNPILTPAISIRWVDNWIRENREIIYRIKPETVTGRFSVKVKISAAFAQPGSPQKPQIF